MSVVAKLRSASQSPESPNAAPEAPLSAMDRRMGRRRITRAGLGAAFLGVAGLTATGLAYQRYGMDRSLSVPTERLVFATVLEQPFSEYAPVTGVVIPKDSIFLPATQGGQVTEILVEEGAYVQAGQPLARLENARLELEVLSTETRLTEQQNNLADARLALEQSELRSRRDVLNAEYEIIRLKDELARYRALATQGAAARAEVEDREKELTFRTELKETLERANASERALAVRNIEQLERSVERMAERLRLVRATLNDLTLEAPISGQLTTFDLELGEVVAAGATIGQIDSVGAFKLSAEIDEFYLGRIVPGQPAEADIAGQRFELEVAKVYPNVSERRFRVDLEFRKDAPDDLRRGQTVRPRIELSAAEDSLVIANGPFFDDTGGLWVFVVASDGSSAERREVSLGRRNPEFVEVLDGLSAGERVIVSSYESFRGFDRIELN